MDTISAHYGQSSRFVPTSMQKVLSAFLEKDYLNRHLRNVISTSRFRKELFLQHLNERLPKTVAIQPDPLGLDIILKINTDINDNLLCKTLGRKNVMAHAYSSYFNGNDQFESGLVMGYASVNEKFMPKKIETIIEVINNTLI